MNINLNKLRDTTLNATITLLAKAKSKPNTLGQTVDELLESNIVSDDDETKLRSLLISIITKHANTNPENYNA